MHPVGLVVEDTYKQISIYLKYIQLGFIVERVKHVDRPSLGILLRILIQVNGKMISETLRFVC